MKTLHVIQIVFAFLITNACAAQDSTGFRGDVGFAYMHIEKGDTLSENGNRPYPMQSVYKFPLALAVLRQVDLGVLSLDQKVHIAKEDYFPTWSPLMKKYPEANVDIPLREILQATISESDNIGCDLLFNLIGGPKKANFYIHSLGITDMVIANTEREMHENPKLQFENWSSPRAMVQLLNLFFQKKILKRTTHKFLWDGMVATYLGKNRMKGLLPENAVVAHRTGTGAPDENGMLGAVNDVGIITLPDGKHLAIAIFITRTSEDVKEAERKIAEVTKEAYDRYARQRK